MISLLQDLKYALRGLRKRPAFAAVVVATLALGIGANTAIFSVVDAVLLRPLPYPGAERLVDLASRGPQGGRFSLSYPDLKDLQTLTRDFDGVAAYGGQRYNLAVLDEAREVRAAVVSPNLFRVLGVSPQTGREFTDDQLREPVALLSYGLWSTAFGRERDIVGRLIRLDGRAFTVVGIMPPQFSFPSRDTQLWVPLGEAFRSDPQIEMNRKYFHFDAVGRLAPGATLERARADVDLVARRITASESQKGGREQRVEINMSGSHPSGGIKVSAAPGVAFMVERLKAPGVESVRTALLVLFGAVGLVLLIACANAASLLVARAAERRREIAVRRALGANRWRLARQLLTESVALALTGGAVGVLLSVWGLKAALAIWPAVPRVGEVAVNFSVLLFALLVSVATGIAFGLLPAFRAALPDLEAELRDEGSAAMGSRRRRRIQSALVVGELALALVLLVASGLLIRSFVRLISVDPGYDTREVLAARVRLTPSRYRGLDQQNEFFHELTDTLRRNPGVAEVSVSRTLPLSGSMQFLAFDPRKIRPDATEPFLAARLSVVGPRYFAAMGIPIKGRGFTSADRADAPKVVVVNKRLADELWPGRDPVGKIFPVQLPGGASYDATVVGLIGDLHYASLDAPLMPEMYLPQLQSTEASSLWVILKARNSPLALAAAVRTAVGQLDPQQPIGEIVSLDHELLRSTADRRLNMMLLSIFAALALTLALVGISAMTAHSVTQRTRELGLRMAVGASPGEVVRMFVRESTWLIVAGLLLGLAGALAATRALRTMVFEVSTMDMPTFVGAALALGGVAIVATYLPARRAAKLDPTEALRAE